jgi:anti-sigma regulatory factor (Ser/Thr protein kinase)
MPVEDSSHVSGARREARTLAIQLGFGEVNSEKVAIVVTEAATNLLKHGGGGVVYLQPTADSKPGVEMIAVDRGPGVIDWQKARLDGFSTSGTAGHGLGSMERNSSFFDVCSFPGQGTVLLARFSGGESDDASDHHPRVSGLQTPKPGEDVSGDAWASQTVGDSRTVILVDGLGHGPEAEVAARTAVEFLDGNAGASPKDLLEIVHRGIRHTRGAAVSIAKLNSSRRTIAFAGLGNVSGRICGADTVSRHLVTLNGTAGMESRTAMREFEYPWPEGSVLIMHSDGLTSRWEFKDYPGLLRHDAAIISGVLLRDFSRGTDDSTVVAVK